MTALQAKTTNFVWTWSKHPTSGMPGDGASDKRAMCAGVFTKDFQIDFKFFRITPCCVLNVRFSEYIFSIKYTKNGGR